MNSYTITKKNITFRFKYDKSIIGTIKALFEDRRYDHVNRTWSAPNTPQNRAYISHMQNDYGFVEDQEVVYDFEELKRIRITTNSFTDEVRRIINKIPFKLKPRDYQVDGVASMLNVSRCLNGDQMGLGKTGQVIVAAEVAQLYPILIVTPSSVKYNWKKEWDKWIDGKDISIIDKKEVNFNSDIVIINYDIVKKHYDKIKKIKWDCIVLDESQYVKNSKSQRSKAVRNLARKIDYVFLLSGTAIMNKPSELMHQLKILKVFETEFGGWKNFIYRYCDAHHTNFGLDISGASNTFELNKRMRETCYVRRETKDIMSELPEVSQQFFEVPFTKIKDYKYASTDIVEYIRKHKGDEKAEAAENAPYLVMANELKQITVAGKITGIKQWIKDFIESTDEKLLVFGRHTQPLEELSTLFKSDLIYGGTSAKNKLRLIESFQVNDKQILFGNIMSLGTGVDGLQDICNNVLFIELPDRPTDLSQAIARVHRSGQSNHVNVYFIFANNSVDQVMWEVLEEKREIIEAINKGKKVKKIKNMNYEIYEKYKN